MKVAIASTDGFEINSHFGHAEYFYIYEMMGKAHTFLEIRSTERFCSKSSNHGKNNGVMEKFASMLSDCEILLCSGIGYYVAQTLATYHLRAYILECDIPTALAAITDGTLELLRME